jgi:broad specificity phosphatase PhoE
VLDLYIVRHGTTEWTRSGQHTGRTDLPLLPEGEEQARLLGRALRGLEFTAVYSSDLRRSLRTAELAGFSTPEQTSLLREYDYGEYEGLTTREIRAGRPDWEIYRDGCPGGETPDEVYARAEGFMELLAGAEGAVLAFTHGHFSRGLAVAWTELPIAAARRLVLDVAAIGVLRDGEPGRVIQCWNLAPTT